MIELPLLGATPSQPEGPVRIWRSAEERRRSVAFKEVHDDEFMPEAASAPSGANRRQFLQVMGASMALAGLTACRKPVEKILPYTRDPEDVIEGIPMFYATAMPMRGVAHALLVESDEGRPTKVEGNPEHPVARGASGTFAQASILNLYDPDRSRRVRRQGADATWQDFVNAARGFRAPMAVLAEPSSSPTQARLRTALEGRFPGLRWITYRPEGDDPFAVATQAAYGRPLRPVFRFEEADVVVSLDADFLSSTDANEVGNARSFAASRRPESGRMTRYYAVESTFSTTGAQADHRLRLKPSRIVQFAQALAQRVGVGGAAPTGPAFTGRDALFLDALAEDVRGKRVLVVAGPSQAPHVHGLALAMTAALGGAAALGLVDTGETAQPPQGEALRTLVADMATGRVQTLLMLGVNPVFDAPGAFNFAQALARVPVSIHVGLHLDETAQKSRWHLPRAHYLEAWGDARAYDGTLSVIQPLIAPLNEKVVAAHATEAAQGVDGQHGAAPLGAETYPTTRDDIHSDIEILNVLGSGTVVSGYDLVRETQGAGGEAAWRQLVHDGYASGGAFAAAGVGAPGTILPAPAPVDGLEVTFRLDPCVFDGAYANNAWMQELPDAVTKLVWDNVALMSRTTAERLGLSVEYDEGVFEASRVQLTVDGRAAELPVWILPGHADDCVTVHLGYGRHIETARPEEHNGFFDTRDRSDVYLGGPLANGVGTNVAPLRDVTFAATAPVRVTKAAGSHTLVSTQEHGTMIGRPLLVETTLAAYQQHPSAIKEQLPEVPGGGLWEEQQPLWDEHQPQKQDFQYEDITAQQQWGMVVDLTTCTGCSACVVACQAENNVQVVGKDQVGKGREMHWLRMDRYFISRDPDEADDDARMGFQFLTCVHCENAPCESVCPVAATVHSSDGTNQMIYNRCIGTRYCSNNCPYKVRRYNWYYWSKHLPLTVQMQQNPYVTVRSRGVMEKCSFCVQRIREVGRRAITENRPVRDGEVQTACQQACATGAITFGNIADPTTAVSLAKRNPRRYELLPDLGTRPRLSYLGRVRNPNPRLEATEPQRARRVPDERNEAADVQAEREQVEQLPRIETTTPGAEAPAGRSTDTN
jgi:MoCo/4Fe-4S cofactor protein with predicted Tat translocation signal